MRNFSHQDTKKLIAESAENTETLTTDCAEVINITALISGICVRKIER